MNLPTSFTTRMQELLGVEYEAFIDSYECGRKYGLRVNTQKITAEQFEKISPFPLEPIPWIPNGYYYEEGVKPAKHPFYFAGLYYLQEPSAMTPANCLPVEPGDYVLDLCAAPGGKATELGAKLCQQGILVANDISNSRAKALLKNIELFGIGNVMVMNEPIDRIQAYFPEYFDKILIDAPCSGEGMFRKDPAIIKSWEKNGPAHYSKIQQELLLKAADLLSPGGQILYSTCTFAPEENEGTIQYLLDRRPDFTVRPLPFYEGLDRGHPEWLLAGDPSLKETVRIWPHKIAGEGHYLALLQKEGQREQGKMAPLKKKAGKRPEELQAFLDRLDMETDSWVFEVRGEKVFVMPHGLPSIKGLRFLRSGLYLGDLKKKRFEPSQAFAMTLTKEQYADTISLALSDERVIRYLKGETIEVGRQETAADAGWQLLCVEGYPLGWGKLNGGTLKNKYHSGWRWM